jgi:hypothetical protein
MRRRRHPEPRRRRRANEPDRLPLEQDGARIGPIRTVMPKLAPAQILETSAVDRIEERLAPAPGADQPTEPSVADLMAIGRRRPARDLA